MASLSLANAAATRRAGKPAVALSARRSVAAQPRVASHAGVAAGRGSLQVFAVRSRSNTGGSRKGLMQYVERVNAPQMKDDLIPFRVGMTVRVGVTVVEGNKTRVQPYEGIIIGVHKAGVATTITVRKAFQGYGVERIFPIHSPLCTFEEVRGAGKPVVSTPSFASSTRRVSPSFATDARKRVSARVSGVPASAPRSHGIANARRLAPPPREEPKPSDVARAKRFSSRPPLADPSPLFSPSPRCAAPSSTTSAIVSVSRRSLRLASWPRRPAPPATSSRWRLSRRRRRLRLPRLRRRLPRLPRLRRRLPPRRRRLPLSPRRKRVDSFLVGVFHGVCPGLAALV